MPHKTIAKRKFLNPPKSQDNGSLKWYLNAFYKDTDDGKRYNEISGGFIIYDCRKGIELELYGDNETRSDKKKFKDSVQKLRWLAESANECADEMEKFWEKYNKES